MPAAPLLKIGELAERAGVSVPTLKHYIREGLIAATRKTGRTMAWYDVALVGRIRAIKEMQETRFLPLDLIRDAIANDREAPDDLTAARAISDVLAKRCGKRTRTRDELVAAGVDPRELDWLAAAGLAVPSATGVYSGDGLALLSTLGAARKAGIAAEMLPFEILHDYLGALRSLVEVELRMFRAGVLARAPRRDVAKLTTAATELSERLVVLLRRQLLLPTLKKLMEGDRNADAPPTAAAPPRRRVRRKPKPEHAERRKGRER